MDNPQTNNHFINLLIMSLSNNAGYILEKNQESVLYKQNVNVFSVIYPYKLEDISSEIISSDFESFINHHRNSDYTKRYFYNFLCVTQSGLSADIKSLMKNKINECGKYGIIADIIVIELNNNSFYTISGFKLNDKSVGISINKTFNMFNSETFDAEKEIDESKKVYIKIQDEMKVKKIKVLNPATILIIINTLIFIIGGITLLLYGENIVIEFGIQDKSLILQHEYWRVFTPMFLHADFTHLFGNMLFLLYMGSLILPFFSNKQFLILYFLSGIAGNIASLLFTDNRSLGASGAIMGLGGLVIYCMFFKKSGYLFRRRNNYFIFAFMICYNLIYGLFVTGIDNFGHFGGFAAGILIAWIFTVRNKENKSA